MDNENAIQATGTFVTNKGFALITKLVAAQAELEFTRAAVGTGSPPEGYSPEGMIGLNAYKMDAQIADYGVQDDTAYITVQVSSDNVTEGFLATEIGIFAEDPDEGEILYGYMNISTDPTYIYANGSSNRSKFAEFTLYLLIGSVSGVIAAVTPGSIITKETFKAANMEATDTHGLLGDEGDASTAQALFDAIVNKIMTELVTNTALMEELGAYILKTKIVNNFLATDAETVLSGPMGKNLKDQLDVLNTKAQWKYVGDSFQDVNLPANTYTEVFVAAFVGDDNSQMIPFLIPLLTTEYSPASASGSHPRYVTVAGTNGGWVSIHYTKTLIRLQNSSAGKNDSGTNKSSIYVYAR